VLELVEAEHGVHVGTDRKYQQKYASCDYLKGMFITVTQFLFDRASTWE
jgi:hypothetical protein